MLNGFVPILLLNNPFGLTITYSFLIGRKMAQAIILKI